MSTLYINTHMLTQTTNYDKDFIMVNYKQTERTQRIDKLPNRLYKFWHYLRTIGSHKDNFLIVSRERVCYDLAIKDTTLTDYIVGTQSYNHMWEDVGGFLHFGTVYGGNLLIIYSQINVDEDGFEFKIDRLKGSMLDLTAKYKKEQDAKRLEALG